MDSFEESIDILKSFEDLGYKKVIITPHVMSDFYKNSIDQIHDQFKQLVKYKNDHNISLEIDYSAEYYLDEYFLSLYDQEEIRTFGNKHFLFELSYFNEQPGVQDFIFRAHNDGYKPILAHPERYPYWNGNIEHFENLRGSGCEFQININSLSGHYGEGPRAMAELMIENNLVDYLCSDCHKAHHVNLMKHTKTKKHLVEMLLSSGMIKNQYLL